MHARSISHFGKGLIPFLYKHREKDIVDQGYTAAGRTLPSIPFRRLRGVRRNESSTLQYKLCSRFISQTTNDSRDKSRRAEDRICSSCARSISLIFLGYVRQLTISQRDPGPES